MPLAFDLAVVSSWYGFKVDMPFDTPLRAMQADKLAHGEGRVRRVIGTAAGYLLNRLPAAVEAALSRDATFPGTPYLPTADSCSMAGECVATAASHYLALASAQ
jgi:hypothetical protein